MMKWSLALLLSTLLINNNIKAFTITNSKNNPTNPIQDAARDYGSEDVTTTTNAPEAVQITNSDDVIGVDTATVTEDVSIVENTNEIPSVTSSYEEIIDTDKPDSAGSNEIPGSALRSSEESSPEVSEATVEVASDNVISTTHGPVKGHVWRENPAIIAYIDIPYGKIESPFEEPESSQSWLDTHEKTEHTKLCPQMKEEEYVGDLDCLTLSIFAPANADNLSVLFHVHDAVFKSGDPLLYGPEHLVPKGIILVLPNYRIGAPGFLCLQNETAPGNAGLKDLSLAVEWVKDNIKSFGGNPSNIVVSGDGAAGALVGYLALYPPSNYYFNKAIIESGSVLSYWALDRNPLKTASALAYKIREDNTEEVTYYNIFAEAPVSTIVRNANGMSFSPCLETDDTPFVGVTPWQAVHENNEDIDITFMAGTATYAGAREAVDMTESYLDDLNDDHALILPNDLQFENIEDKIKNALKIKKQYFGSENITVNHLEELSLCITDCSYLGPVMRFSRSLVNAGLKVYLYEFGFVGKLNKQLAALDRPIDGAIRSDIVGYVFKQSSTEVEVGSPEEHMVNLMVNMWVSFIDNGQPVVEGVEWNELQHTDASQEEWLHITSEPKMVKGVHMDRLQLWTSLYEDYFIERNNALNQKPNYFPALIPLVTLFISNIEFNYKGH